MKKKIYYIILILFSIILISNSTSSTYADAGGYRGSRNFTRNVPKGNFSRNRDFKKFRDDGYINHGHRGYGFSSGFFLGNIFSRFFSTGFIGLIILIIIFNIIRSRRNYGSDESILQEDLYENQDSFEVLLNKDPNFSKANLEKRVARIFVEMQKSWMDKRFEPMRAYLDSEFYTRLNNQLLQLKKEGKTNIIENIAVIDVDALEYLEDGKNQIVDVKILARFIDYTVDKDGRILVGSNTDEVFMTYIYKMVRPINSLTVINQDFVNDKKAMKCPNCGAPIDVYKSAECEYCGSIIEIEEHDWIVADIELISQQ